jgi:hypothetical protein
MKKLHRFLFEISVIVTIIAYFFSTLWLIPWMLFGLIYQPISWISLDWLLTPFLFISILSIILFWIIIVRWKSKTIKSILGQDLTLIIIGLPFSNTFLSLFKLDIDGGLAFPLPMILIAVLTFLIVQINHLRKF